MTARRKFLAGTGANVLALALCSHAWPQGRQVRVGLLTSVRPPAAMLSVFREGLRARGYVDGQNLAIDMYWLEGALGQGPAIASAFVRRNVDVIVAWSTPAVIAARHATSTIPIVMLGVSDPVGAGFIASLARPGGNVTGLTNVAAELSAKLMEIFVEIVPRLDRIAVVFNHNNPGSVVQMRGVEDAVRALGLQLQTASARTPQEYESAFARFSATGVKGVVLTADSALVEHRTMIAELAKRTRLPTAFQRRENVVAGGLSSYGPSLNDQFRQAALYVDRILRGEKPADLPVQAPTKFELVINLKTARAIGLTVPPILLARADEVIE